MLVVHTHRRATSPKNAELASAPSDSSVPFEAAAATVLGRLQEAFSSLLGDAPGPTGKCTDIERTFGIDAKLSWQLFRMVTATNPLAVGTNVPARVSVQRLLKSALRRGVGAEVIDQVTAAYDEYERFTAEYAENREALEVMISAHVPESREKNELASKQTVFKAMSQIRGVVMDTTIQTFFMSPAADGQTVEIVALEGFFGLHRVKPESRVGFSSASLDHPEARPLTLSGGSSNNPTGTLLTEFCTSPLPRIEFEEIEGTLHHLIVGQDVGLRGAVDLVSAWRVPSPGRRFHRPGEAAKTGPLCIIDTPMKRLVCDAFVHKDLYLPDAPELRIYQLGLNGHLRAFADPSREGDRLDMRESIRSLGYGLSGARLTHMTRYVDMLEHVYRTTGWSAAQFRGYRLDVAYPVHGSQYHIGFKLPEAP